MLKVALLRKREFYSNGNIVQRNLESTCLFDQLSNDRKFLPARCQCFLFYFISFDFDGSATVTLDELVIMFQCSLRGVSKLVVNGMQRALALVRSIK